MIIPKPHLPADAGLERGHDHRQLLITQILQTGQDTGLEEHLGVAQLELLVLQSTALRLTAQLVRDALAGRLLVRNFGLVRGQNRVTVLEYGRSRDKVSA